MTFFICILSLKWNIIYLLIFYKIFTVSDINIQGNLRRYSELCNQGMHFIGKVASIWFPVCQLNILDMKNKQRYFIFYLKNEVYQFHLPSGSIKNPIFLCLLFQHFPSSHGTAKVSILWRSWNLRKVGIENNAMGEP